MRVWLDLMNEAGGRAVMPFDGMIPADAYLWARYRDDAQLQKKLGEITQKQFDSRRGFYGTVGDACVIKNCQIIKDVKIGPSCYIKGANKLKNLTINSSEEEPTQIGEGVELVNGIVGLGLPHLLRLQGRALRHGQQHQPQVRGAADPLVPGRQLHRLLLRNAEQPDLPGPRAAPQQLVPDRRLLMGQSNLAAGATVGSNHNSRANDGEIQAGRGFWPGLCTTLKHSCRFASFTLLAKGDYPAELNIPLPFSLLSDDPARDRLVVMPAYWWLHNMYALARNTWKFQSRDKRKTKVQHIEFDCLAPDTVEEIFDALELLELWTAKAHLRATRRAVSNDGSRKN